MHLFLTCPLGIATFPVNRWNQLCRTIVYEDIRVASGRIHERMSVNVT
jgi:hypothetical protein